MKNPNGHRLDSPAGSVTRPRPPVPNLEDDSGIQIPAFFTKGIRALASALASEAFFSESLYLPEEAFFSQDKFIYCSSSYFNETGLPCDQWDCTPCAFRRALNEVGKPTLRILADGLALNKCSALITVGSPPERLSPANFQERLKGLIDRQRRTGNFWGPYRGVWGVDKTTGRLVRKLAVGGTALPKVNALDKLALAVGLGRVEILPVATPEEAVQAANDLALAALNFVREFPSEIRSVKVTSPSRGSRHA